MKKILFIFSVIYGCLLPFPELHAHGDPGTVLLAVGIKKTLETFAKKYNIITQNGQILTAYYQDDPESKLDNLYIERKGQYHAVKIPSSFVAVNEDKSGRIFLLFKFISKGDSPHAAVFTGRSWYLLDRIDFPRDMVVLNLNRDNHCAGSMHPELFYNAWFEKEGDPVWTAVWIKRYKINSSVVPPESQIENFEEMHEIKSVKDVLPIFRNSVRLTRDVAKELKNYRITPDTLKEIPISTIEDWSSTPEAELYRLAATSDLLRAEKLLKSGVDVNAASPCGRTALMNAALHGNIPMLKLLLAYGANLNAVNFNGETALFYAVYGESQAALELLLRHTAEPYQVNRFGENLLMIAVSKNSALSSWLLNFEKKQLKNTPSRYRAHKNNAGETVADYEVQINPVVKGE